MQQVPRQYIDFMPLFWPTWLSFVGATLPALPHQCLACYRWPSPDALCPDCWQRFYRLPVRCHCCALALPGLSPARPICGQCLRQPPVWRQAVAWQDYSYPWHRLVQQWKAGQQPGLARHLARWMRDDTRVQTLLGQADMVVPIPMSSQRLRERGYHPAAQLAQHLHTRTPPTPALLRPQHTPSQQGLTRAQRLRNLRNAFAVAPQLRPSLHGQSVLLIDDVMTTGATFSAAAQCLLQGGAARVHVLCFARTP